MMGEGGGGLIVSLILSKAVGRLVNQNETRGFCLDVPGFFHHQKINSSLQGLGFSCLQQGPTEYRLLKKSSLCFTAVATCALCRPILAPSKPMTSWQLQTGFLLHSAKSRIRGLVTSSEVSHQFPDFR